MQNQPGGPTYAWEIDHSEDALVGGAGRLAGRGKRVWFRTFDGNLSYVEVTLADFTPEKVAQLINQDVERLLTVHQLKGPELPPPLS